MLWGSVPGGVWVRGRGGAGAGRNVGGTWLERAECVQAGYGQVGGLAECPSGGRFFRFSLQHNSFNAKLYWFSLGLVGGRRCADVPALHSSGLR